MGYCCSKQKSNKVNASTVYYGMDVKYPRRTLITIKKRNSREKIIHRETLELINTHPIFVISDTYTLPIKVLASACVLPGKDPRGNFNKVCRDFCFLSSENGYLIGGLFDGHGKEGEKVVSFCISETDYFFSNYFNKYIQKPITFLDDTLKYLENQLNETSGIDISNSGASCVIFLQFGREIYTANLGCSRLILASNNLSTDFHKRRFSFNNNFQFLSQISDARRKGLKDSLSAIQLTTDHKPNSAFENERIVSKGGVVKKLSDIHGNHYGPYRVSHDFSRTKGLTISRSLGSLNMRDIGVTAIPSSSLYHIENSDKFYIVASDGIWRVMTNKDVVDFVESHREICLKGVERPTVAEVITPENSCIAQLLCEEARLRWLAIVENEDILIDDISCIVVEFEQEQAANDKFVITQDYENEDKENIGKLEEVKRAHGSQTLGENYFRKVGIN